MWGLKSNTRARRPLQSTSSSARCCCSNQSTCTSWVCPTSWARRRRPTCVRWPSTASRASCRCWSRCLGPCCWCSGTSTRCGASTSDWGRRWTATLSWPRGKHPNTTSQGSGPLRMRSDCVKQYFFWECQSVLSFKLVGMLRVAPVWIQLQASANECAHHSFTRIRHFWLQKSSAKSPNAQTPVGDGLWLCPSVIYSLFKTPDAWKYSNNKERNESMSAGQLVWTLSKQNPKWAPHTLKENQASGSIRLSLFGFFETLWTLFCAYQRKMSPHGWSKSTMDF